MAAEAVRWLGLARVAPLVTALACEGRVGSAPEARPPAEPTLAQVVSALSDGGAGMTATLAEGLPRLTVVLDDPRLAVARDRAEAKDDFAAAREVDRVRAEVTLDTRATCEWDYVAGRLHLSAGDASDAVAAFERAASAGDGGAPCALAGYARLREAEALVRAGRYDEAVTWAESVSDEIAAHDETKLALADALSGKGDRAAAIAIWRAFLAANPHGLRWVDLSIQLATALLDGVDGPPKAAAAEAIDLVTRVMIEAPMTADKLAVADLRQRAGLVSKAVLKPLTLDERGRQAQAWLDASQAKHARDEADEVLAAIPKGDGPHHALACSVAVVRAQATPRSKAEDAAAAWGAAIARCETEDLLVTALYYGARASVSAHHDAEAIARFDKVEKLFPTHRLADDARFRAALTVQDDGDEVRAMAMLASVPDAYPQGDMGGEALFRVALEKLEAHDLAGARDVLDRALVVAPSPPASKRADYFRARMAELMGAVEDAKRRYVALVADAPLDYYMLLAYARLRALDDAMARATLEGAVAREAGGPPATREHPEDSPVFRSPGFDRFVSLLEVGDVDAARREVSAHGLVGDGVDPQVLWTVGWLWNHAGAPDVGHGFARGRSVHWPAGRWKLPWEVAFPRAFDATVSRESDTNRIPAPLTWAIMREESAFNPEAKSITNATGLMQLMAGTARLVAKDAQYPLQLPYDEPSLHRPAVSIALGARLLGSLRGTFPSHPALAIAAYNAGSNAVRRWLVQHGADDFDVFVERIPFEETRNYVKHVLTSEAAYAYLYAPAALDEILTLPAHLVAPPVVTTP